MNMKSSLRLRHSTFDGVREIGGFGQPLHALYPQIRAMLAKEFGVDGESLLAEPVVDRDKNRIDWYAEGDPDEKPALLVNLSDKDRRPILDQFRDLLGRAQELAERYAASDNVRQAQLGAILRAVLTMPAESEVFVVEGKPVITGWGFASDSPWGTPGGLSQRLPLPAEPVEPTRDVVVPEVAIPELAVAPEPTSPAPLPVDAEPRPSEPSSPPEPEPAPKLFEPSPSSPDASMPEAAPQPVDSRPPAESVSEPIADMVEQPVANKSSTSFRYVVVGSRYFWTVAIIALLLVLLAAYWALGRTRLPRPMMGEATLSTAAGKLDSALNQARQDEAGLRVRLEQLLVQLAERHGQCRVSDQSAVTAVVPAPKKADMPDQVLPSADRDRLSSSSDGVGAKGGLPNRSADHERAPPTLGGADGKDATPSLSRQDRSLSGPASNSDGQRGSAARDLPVDPAVLGTSPQGQAAGAMPTETPTTVPLASGSAAPSSATRPSVGGTVNSSKANGSQSESPSPASSGVAVPERTLEEVLSGRDSESTTPARPQSPAEPPVKAEPTPEERREFVDRMSATGATTGEITATLLWNGRGDLDLVVRCPSGRQLDYRSPTECGGTLDVDANATRGGLSDRPVENAFWPAGKAGPGVYEVVVRYTPRKDEERPREMPFQVRLSRGGQESVFKGTIRPNAVVPVTTFTVQR